jgi:hypothetical protein
LDTGSSKLGAVKHQRGRRYPGRLSTQSTSMRPKLQTIPFLLMAGLRPLSGATTKPSAIYARRLTTLKRQHIRLVLLASHKSVSLYQIIYWTNSLSCTRPSLGLTPSVPRKRSMHLPMGLDTSCIRGRQFLPTLSRVFGYIRRWMTKKCNGWRNEVLVLQGSA